MLQGEAASALAVGRKNEGTLDPSHLRQQPGCAVQGNLCFS